MSFRMVSLIASRLGKVSVMPTRSCSRNVSRDASKAWMDQRQTHRTSAHRHREKEERFEDPDMDDVDDKVQAVFSEERRRQRTVKYHIVKRQLTESGAPERKLSWDAMEQIRYLKQELPEEWTIDRLAEGFSVHRDIILRVLRSKFTPKPERKAKQDASVWARLRQQALPGSGAGGQGRQQALPGGGAGGQDRQQALPGGGAGGQGRQQALPGGGAGGQGRQQALPGGGAGGQDRQQALPGSGAGGQDRQQALSGSGAGGQGRQQALPGGGAGGQGRQQALPGGGAGGQGRQQALPGGGGAGGPGRPQLPAPGHRSSKPAMLPAGSGTGALVTLASHSSQRLIARDLEDGPGPRAMMTTANSPAAPLTSLPTQLSSSPTLHRRHTSGQDNSREEWEEEENVPEDNVSEKVEEKDDQEERWDGRVFSEEELEELMLSSKPSRVVQNGIEFFDSEGNFLYRI
ncbi:keratin, type I cytoskeletal 9-like isoform X1 [Salvelinus fontinalis]|uniref:keratin, type I cytoskeletal 9-like isoform X1 n=2 Tax=Salvelinus fontinalis TaxID=8038 RepID=UPI002485EDD6|nr:keratin, type I cytoskeletal 9-like isoform X1 [Salvelinus fontinalis]XP_055788609.1 keratin, type I cytoskeletal 9-like isoform X1 [Salvelinus fontinalis]XP_055788610.1 keratin, type I cytoskeletal 9-like isoform X1 [Salvelinus fontinalis]